MLLDLMAGRRSEIDFINGAIPRAGAGVGVAAPFNEAVTALVRALELGTVDAILEELRDPGRDRVTLRQDVPGDYAFPVTHEALARASARCGTSERSTCATSPSWSSQRRPGRPGRLPRRIRRSGVPARCSRPTAGSPRRSSRR